MDIFCTECGKKITRGNGFCTECGKPIYGIQAEPQIATFPSSSAQRKKKNFLAISTGLGIITLLIFALVFVLNNSGKIQGKKIKDGIIESQGITIKTDITDGYAALKVEKASDREKENGAITDVAVVEYEKITDKDVTIEMPVNKKASKGLYMMGIGIEVYNQKKELERIYRYFDVKITNNKATAKFNLKDELEDKVYFAGTDNDTGKRPKCLTMAVLYNKWAVKDLKNDGHFRIIYPQKYIYKDRENDFMTMDESVKLMSVFEEIYDLYIEKYKYQYKKRTEYPMDIHIENLQETDGYFRRGFNIDNAYIAINSKLFWRENKKISELDKGKISDRIKSVFAHEFFHFVQANYYNQYANSTWFGEATASYFESLYMPGYMDSIDLMNDNWKKMYQGLFPSSDKADEGYARMPLIEFFVAKKKQDTDFIRQIYQTDSPITNNGWNQHIIKKIGINPVDYVVEFYCDLLMKKVRSYKEPYQIYDAAVISAKDMLNVDGVCTALKVSLPEYKNIENKLKTDTSYMLKETKVTVPAYGARLIALDMLANVTIKDKYPEGSFIKIKHPNECEVKIIEIDENNRKNTILDGDNISDIKRKIGRGFTYMLLVASLKDKEVENTVKVYIHEKDQSEKISNLEIIPGSSTVYEEIIGKVLSKKGSINTSQNSSDKKAFNISVNGLSAIEKSGKPTNDEVYTSWNKVYKINNLLITANPIKGGKCSISANLYSSSHNEEIEKSAGDYFNVEECKISDLINNAAIEGTGKIDITKTYDEKHGNYKKITMVFDSVKITGARNYKQTYESRHPNNPDANRSETLADKNEQVNTNDSIVLRFIIKN